MAGRGPAPKDPSKRARRNKEPAPLKVLPAVVVEQPKLPTIYVDALDENGNPCKRRFHWPKITRQWWRMWAESPLSKDYTDTDWSFLLDTALIHARYWATGNTGLAAELRLRVAKFGATPEDRARLRITFATADAAEDGEPAPITPAAASGARSRSRAVRLIE